MHTKLSAGLALALLTVGGLAALPAHAGGPNLVTNPGFETGDFTGWAIGSPGDLKVVSASSVSNYNNYPPHTGTYSAQFASSATTDDVLSQTATTRAGEKYAISFWLANDDQGVAPQNDFKVAFGGDQLLDLEKANDFPYTLYQFTASATGTTTPLTFSGRQPPGALYLDDVSVTDAGPVPEASSVVSFGLLLLLGVGGVAVSRRRKAAG